MVQPLEDLDFICFKDILVHMGMLTEQQAISESRESSLIYDVWYSLSQLRPQDTETVKLDDLRVFSMAVQRLNDDKNFTAALWEQKNRVYGQILDGKLMINNEEYKLIKKNFEQLYANHLQFVGKLIEAQKAQKLLDQ